MEMSVRTIYLLVILVVAVAPAWPVVAGLPQSPPTSAAPAVEATTVPEAPQPSLTDSAVANATGSSASELLSFEDIPLVIGAAKHEQRQADAPASVTVVTADEIEIYGYRSLADILRTQPGFYVHSDGLNSFVGVRGFLRPGEWNARVLVLVDGRPTREPTYGQTHLDRDMVVPIELIKRVEIIRGPGSALYGANAVFAVINIITRSGADVANYGEVKTQGGNKDTGRVAATAGHKFDNGWDIIASGDRFTSQGDRDIHYPNVNDPAYNYGHIINSDYEGSGSMFIKATNGDFTVEADYMKRIKDNSAATFLASWFNSGQMREDRSDFSLRYDHQIDDELSLHALAFYSTYGYRQHWGIDATDDVPAYTYYTRAVSAWCGQDVHLDWQTSTKNRVIFGTEAMESTETLQNDYNTVDGTLLDTNPSFNWWSLYAQDEYTPQDWVTFVAGLRGDFLQRFNPLLDPRLAVILRISQEDTVKLMYGRAFRAPNLYEMFYNTPGTNTGNTDLKPEINNTYEADWEHDFHNGWVTDVNYYLWRMSGTLDNRVLADGSIQTENTGTSWAQGVETEIQRRWSNGARIRGSACVGHAEDSQGQRLTLSPDVVLALAGDVPVINKQTFLSLETQMVGPMLSDLGANSNPSFLTNIVLTSRRVYKGLDLQVGVYNLFGNSARVPRDAPWNQNQPWLREPGVLAMVSLTYHF